MALRIDYSVSEPSHLYIKNVQQVQHFVQQTLTIILNVATLAGDSLVISPGLFASMS